MNKKVVIDAGHGGSDPGASANGLLEKDYTLLISNYIYNNRKKWVNGGKRKIKEGT